jgi:hypothetical protein
MRTSRSLIRRIGDRIASPLRIFDENTTFDLDLDADDLIADLDSGWLDWRSRISQTADALREVA